MQLPRKLIIRNGKLEMRDGTDPAAYLREWQATLEIADETEVTLCLRNVAQMVEDNLAEQRKARATFLDSKFSA